MNLLWGTPAWTYYVTRENELIIAAAALRPGEYVFCKRGSDNGLDAAAEVGAGRFELENRPPSEWHELDTFRALFYGVAYRSLHVSPVAPEWESVELTPGAVLDHVVSMVASDLPEPTRVTTYLWPWRTVETRFVQPDPPVRLLLQEAANHHRHSRERAQVEREAERREADAARVHAEAVAAAVAEEARLADADEFTCDDLLAAAMAVGQRSSLEGWGTAVLAAFEQLQRDRGDRSADLVLLDVLRRTAHLRHQAVSPFDGMLEAPPEVHDFYDPHAPHLHRLIATRDEVLDDLMSDLTYKLVEMLPGNTPRWGELANLGAVRQQPSQPEPEDFDLY